jgi:hypothetical protein
MSDEPSSPSPRHEALMVWVKLVGLLAALCVFGWIIFRLSRALH